MSDVEKASAARSLYEAEIETLQSRLDAAESALRRKGYRRSCDIPACNCGDQWNHGGHASERLSELSDVIRENGVTLLDAAKNLVQRLGDAEEQRDEAREAQRGNYAAGERLRTERDAALLRLNKVRELLRTTSDNWLRTNIREVVGVVETSLRVSDATDKG